METDSRHASHCRKSTNARSPARGGRDGGGRPQWPAGRKSAGPDRQTASPAPGQWGSPPKANPTAGLEAFLDACRRAAGGGHVRFVPGREGIAADYELTPNPECRSVLDGQPDHLPVLSALHLRARCHFRLPLDRLPEALRLVPAGDDLEVLNPADEPGDGEPIGAALLDADELIESLLMPAGLAAFADEHLDTARGCRDLVPRFRGTGLQFEIAGTGASIDIHCTFTAEMDAYPK